MTVWVCLAFEPEDANVLSIHSTQELAENAAQEYRKTCTHWRYGCEVHEHEVLDGPSS